TLRAHAFFDKRFRKHPETYKSLLRSLARSFQHYFVLQTLKLAADNKECLMSCPSRTKLKKHSRSFPAKNHGIKHETQLPLTGGDEANRNAHNKLFQFCCSITLIGIRAVG